MFRGAIEPWHILVLVLIVVILFGWKKLPDAARSLGRSARILKNEMGGDDEKTKSSASSQTVPGETARPGGVPGEAPPPQNYSQQPGAHPASAQQPAQPQPAQPQPAQPQPAQPQPAQQPQPQQRPSSPQGYPQQSGTGTQHP